MLYRELAPAVHGYLSAQGAHEPEDLTGEVFLQVVRDLHRFDGDERSLRAWVFTIAHRRLLDDRRRSRRRPAETSIGPSELARGAPAPRDEQLVAPSAEEQALADVGAERVRRLIDDLPAAQRTVLLLRVLGGLTVRETAAATRKRPGAVKALQRRGVAAIRNALAGEGVPL